MSKYLLSKYPVSKYSVSKYPDAVTLRDTLDETLAGWQRERPDLDLAAMATTLRLSQLTSLALRGIEAVMAPHGITLGEFDVLAALRRSGDGAAIGPTALAKVAMVSPAGMTNRLDRLEAAGLVLRRPDPSDRRGSLVQLTDRGRAVADRAVGDLVDAENAQFAALSPTQHGALDRALDLLIANLERSFDDRR